MISLTLLLLGLTFFIHLGIIVFFTFKIQGWKSANQTHKPTISIIIAARNELNNLQKLMPKLIEQDYANFEIIIGLDRCSDQSYDYLNSLEKKNVKTIPIKEIPSDWNSKKYVLNECIKESKNDWLVFTDADCTPVSNQWLVSLSKEMSEHTDIILGVSPYVSNRGFLGYYIRFEAFMTYFLYIAFTLIKKPYMAVGRNMAIKRDFFISQNRYEGFKSVIGGDDDLFIQKTAEKAHISIAIGEASLVNTYPTNSWKDYFNQKKRHFSVSRKYSSKSITMLSLYHLVHFSHYLILLPIISEPYFLPIILFSLFIKLVSYRFVAQKIGAGFNYILFPLVDIMYAIFTPILGIWSKLVKDIKWKN